MACRGRCEHPDYETAPLNCRPPGSPPAGTYGRFSKCPICRVYIVWEGVRCPCCSTKLSKRPRKCRVQRTARLREAAATMIASVAPAPAPAEPIVAAVPPPFPVPGGALQ